jgi:hypothetical protein
MRLRRERSRSCDKNWRGLSLARNMLLLLPLMVGRESSAVRGVGVTASAVDCMLVVVQIWLGSLWPF